MVKIIVISQFLFVKDNFDEKFYLKTKYGRVADKLGGGYSSVTSILSVTPNFDGTCNVWHNQNKCYKDDVMSINMYNKLKELIDKGE